MKKGLYVVTMLLLVVLLSTGCGLNPREAVAGTWYGDNDDTLILQKDGSYTSTWLSTGKYRVDGETIVLTGSGMAEGSIKELRINKSNDKTVLHEEKLALTYYADSSEAAEAIEKREEAVRKEEEQQVAKELDTLKENLIGTWEWAGYAGEVIFGADGTISGTVSGMKPGTYKVVDLNIIEITNEEQVYTKRIQYSKEDSVQKLIFGPLNLVKK